MSMLTNGHVSLGLRYGEDRVSELPLEEGGNFQVYNPYTVQDSNGLVLAAFRNKTDQEDFINRYNKRVKKEKRK